MSRRGRVGIVLLWAVATLLPTVPVVLGVAQGAVAGTVLDSLGAPVPCPVDAIDPGVGFSVASDTPDAAGHYAITGLAPGSYTIRSRGCVYRADPDDELQAYPGVAYPGAVTVTGGVVTAGIDLTLTATAPAILDVTLVDPLGFPVYPCAVTVTDAASGYGINHFTDAAGRIVVSDLPPDPVTLTLFNSGTCNNLAPAYYDGAASQATADPVTLTAGGTTEITWRPGGTSSTQGAVAGTVLDSLGAPVPCPVDAIDPGVGFSVASDTPDAAGHYAITGLAPGSYTIRSRGCVYRADPDDELQAYPGVAYPGAVTVTGGVVTAGIDLTLTATAPAILDVTLVDPLGFPVYPCAVTVTDAASGYGINHFTDAAGRIVVSDLPPDPVTLTLFNSGTCNNLAPAYYDGAASQATADPVTLTAGGTTEITWRPGGTSSTQGAVAGTVLDSLGAPVPCPVDAIDPGVGFSVASDTPDAAGHYAITGLAPGSYTIRSRGCVYRADPDDELQAYPGVAYPGAVTVTGGVVTAGIDLTLTATAPAILDVTLVDPLGFPVYPCAVTVTDAASGYGINHFTDAAGRIVVSDLPPDPVTLTLFNSGTCNNLAPAYYDGAASQATADPVTLTAGGTTEITWRPGGTSSTDGDAPTIRCDAPPTAWQATEVSISCTAVDTDSGLADPGDASFVLQTTVGTDHESATAATGAREVCDEAGNCATAGPISGLKVDRKAPSVTITSPVEGASVLVNAAVTPSVSCTDGGSGTVSCSSAGLDTSHAGVSKVNATAVDAVGNTGGASTSVVVRYATCAVSAKTSKSAIATVIVKVCDATGSNLSSSGLTVTAVGLRGPSGPATLVTPAGPAFGYVIKSRSYLLTVDAAGLPRGTYTLDVLIGADTVSYPLAFKLR